MKRDEELKLSEMKKQVPQSHKMTDKLVENTKRQKLNEIFDLMDSDFDGVVSAQKIELGGLNQELVQIF